MKPLHCRWLLMLAVTVFAGVVHADAGFLAPLERGPLPRIKSPPVRTVVLPNGMRCFLLEDHALPIVKVRAIVRAGSIYDPPRLVGLANLAGMLLRSGGAGGYSPGEFDAALDDIGAVLGVDIDHEMGRISLEVLSSDLERGLSLLFDMIFEPRFDAKRLKAARLAIEEYLRREDDMPGALASRHFRQLLYGKESPWARRPTKRSLGRIRLEDIREFHRNYFKAGNILFAAAGDFDSDQLIGFLKEVTSDAPRGDIRFPEVAPVRLEFKPDEEGVVRPTSQAFIRMGHLGIKRHSPDRFPLFIMADILGATNFKSRLMEDIRTKKGMAYSIGCRLQPGEDYGVFIVSVSTAANQSERVIDLIRGHIERMATKADITEEELDFAKRSVLSSIVFKFDSAFKVVDHSAMFFFYGFPQDYWRIYRDEIAKVRREDVQRVAREYLHPDGLKVVVVGPKTGRR